MTATVIIVIFIISLALIFDFLNGFHDAANAIATIVVTKVLTPLQAVLFAGAANFIGYFTFGVAVATTVGKGIIVLQSITLPIICAALVGAILWNLITWFLGLPTSSSHALIGGLVGSALAATGSQSIIWPGVFKIVSFILIAPLIGFLGSLLFTTLIFSLIKKQQPARIKKVFPRLQILSSMVYSIGHGTNDAQKSMGIIALALYAGGITQSFHLQSWIIFSCYSAIALGTMFGGWRIVRTMGTQIAKIRPIEGFCAETAAASVLLVTAHFGVPVSTTHVITGSIMGVGTVHNAAKVRWITARTIVWAWFLTIPLTGICSGIVYFLIRYVLSFFI